ncbi:Fur family transcriptional regulator, iron response regulator [Aliiroseovarius halocynthiae]|uniref:Ferric uptake regulation protein n=1 Tax=Aliiroseovarius halocynthiae TaxID=985055 RepID=A0A545SYF1_9RHOB|nr:Fur family transcriptional regulator [Aliiroseovarius halocynthiae]TQV69990.1 transcriptional repressor [Aliiroseovarius halocynthiae]SMR70656.1 Fur family transcriptional regulator, iron response regulator [Aliiroseovarius halocynthiae]
MMQEKRQTEADWLSSAGLRPTRQRLALAHLLIGDGQHRHVTAESLYEATRDGADKVSLATVYNTLRVFSEAGLLREITVNGARSYFDTNVTNHPHFFWEDSEELMDAPDEDLKIAQLPEAPEGAEISKVDVVIRLRRS